MQVFQIFEVTARSFTGRIPCDHRFEIAGEDEDEARNAIKIRWPALYDVKISKKEKQR